jgi:non-heme chloroperoxidase
MNLAILRAVFRKDVSSLAPMMALVALLFLGNAIVHRLDLMPAMRPYTLPVLMIALVVLVLSVFQTDSAASHTDDWLCRPVPKRDLLGAKFLLVLCATWLPGAVGTFFSDLGLGYPISEALLDALLLPDELPVFLLPVLLFTAIVTRTLVQGFGVLFAIFVAVFVLPTPFVREPGPLEPGLRDALFFSGMRWLSSAPAEIAMFVLVALGFWLVYWRRQLAGARLLLTGTLLVALLLALSPMALLPWKSTFELQRALGPAAPDVVAPISLRPVRACFPATRRDELMTDAAFAAAIQASRVKLWDDEALSGVGADSIAFLTEVEPRGLPLDWRVKLNYVQATYSAGAQTSYSLRPARYFNERSGGGPLVHAWMLPSAAVQPLKASPARLELTYSVTLLEPREYRVPTDGKRRAFPGLGYCSATVDDAYDRIDVDCFGGVASPAQISAELNDIPASRVYGSVDLAPAWARWPYGRRAELAIASPRLAAHETITVTAWDVAGYQDSTLTLPGILGADPSSCPLPSDDAGDPGKGRWTDAAPHRSRQVDVEAGVQLEVLDFGGTGAPVLLLPGLGATAHSYDDLAPLLARKHRVVALTRRGTGYSSRPDFGYDTPRLAADVLEVMRAMELDRVLLVGHSIAGEELTWLGGHHPERFAGLVYLDAAYDRSGDRHAPTAVRLRELHRSLPPAPPIPAQALRDYGALSRWLASQGHARYPEGELISFLRVNSPFIAGTPAIDARTQQAINAAIRPPDFARLQVPALAVYAFEDPHAPLPPWYDADDPQLAATLAEIARIMDARKRASIELFKRDVRNGRVLEMQDATHNLILSNPQEVLEAIEGFAATPDVRHRERPAPDAVVSSG